MLVSAGFVLALIIGSALYAADDATKSDATPAHVTRGGGRLVKPWSDLKDLSYEQTDKLKEIHSKYLAQMSEIRAKEKEECMEVLTDDQKKELVDKAAADRKAKAATAPSDSTK
jgi:Spy/CpxP family protein refolding chaperone